MIVVILMSYFVSSIGYWVYLFTKKEAGKKLGFSFYGIGFLLQLAYIGIKDIQARSLCNGTQRTPLFFLPLS
ncbi:MAG: hypothetical protein Q9M89_03380 [Persephonella sp.]|nr:hypothetical protein [Persephonella sp.]